VYSVAYFMNKNKFIVFPDHSQIKMTSIKSLNYEIN
jgi:hypothetical protein